jgi:DNA-directed RNA polymerase specialized sigma24 family protein
VVLELRYWEQLSGAEAAAHLGCSENTVKSAAARGLRRLRELADAWPDTGAHLHDMTSTDRSERS